jgi:tRNA-dihydrouridine synthase B
MAGNLCRNYKYFCTHRQIFPGLQNMLRIGNIELPDFPLLLAPMEDITDPPFRLLCKESGADLVYTEFVSSEGLMRQVEKTRKKLVFADAERPIGAQIFGNNAESMKAAAEAALAFSPELIDINFGCPVKKIVAKGCGAALLQDTERMVEITRAVVNAVKIPVTVKTRLGWDEKHKPIVALAEKLQDTGIAAISIHGRTKAQMYTGTADWTLIGEVKNNPHMHIPVIGNGDIDSPRKALEMKNRYGVDALMIGRAAIGYPWIFREIKHFLTSGDILPKPLLQERISVCQTHLLGSAEWKGEKRGVLEMRKHYSGYFKGYPNFKPYRVRLMNSTELQSTMDLLEEIKSGYAE